MVAFALGWDYNRRTDNTTGPPCWTSLHRLPPETITLGWYSEWPLTGSWNVSYGMLSQLTLTGANRFQLGWAFVSIRKKHFRPRVCRFRKTKGPFWINKTWKRLTKEKLKAHDILALVPVYWLLNQPWYEVKGVMETHHFTSNLTTNLIPNQFDKKHCQYKSI